MKTILGCIGVLIILFEVAVAISMYITRHHVSVPLNWYGFLRVAVFFIVATSVGYGLILMSRGGRKPLP